MRFEQSWLVLDNPRPSQPKEDNIVAGIHQHNDISSGDQLCQDSGVGTPRFQPPHAIFRQYFSHLSGNRGLAQQESSRAFQVYGGYLFEYYQLWDTAARHADRLNNWSSESCRMHIWLAQLSLRQEADLAYPTTNCLCSSRCIFSDFPSLWGAPVQNRGAPGMGDVPTRTGFIWEYRCSIMFRRYVSHLQSKFHRRAQNCVERDAFAGHLLIGMIRFWSCPVHASDVDLSTISFAG